jgi:dipeptidyl aminopeptidase/acylaminoacyl peptidase
LIKSLKMKNQLIVLTLSLCFAISCNEADTPRIVQEYTIDQFMANKSVFGSSFSSDESKLLVGSNETGIFNAYEVDLNTGEKTALTSSEDRTIRPISYFPDDDRILYISDNNGDEIDHIFMQDIDGNIKDLTPAEGAKAGFAGWADDDKSFFYTSNERNPQFFDYYEMNIDDFSSERIYQNDDGKNVNSLSRDKKYMALSKSVNTNDSDVFLVDLSTGEETKLNENQAGHSIADFSVDSKKLYYMTDEGAEFQYLIGYDIESGTKEKVLQKDWDIWYTYFSKTGKYRVSGINQDAKTVIEIQDTESGENISVPDVGDKEITSVRISDSESKMAFYAGGSNAPSDLYIYDLESKEVKKLTSTLNDEIDSADLVRGEVVRFKSYDGLEIPGILYKPHNASADQKVPGIIQVHGGPGGQTRLNYSSLYQYLVNHGYAVLCVNNRGSSGYGKTFFQLDDQKHGDVDLKDVVEGKNYLVSLDFVESDNIGILGGSYGGYMVMRAMTHVPDEFNVGVNIFGVTNWLRTLKSIPPWWGSFKDALYLEMGDPNTADSVRLYNISPLFHGHQVKNPVMVLQGAKDPRVLQVESDEMVAAIEAQGVPVEYVLFEDEGHGFRKKENQIEGWGKIMSFLDRNMKVELKD